jgi:hypothetical protein
MSQAVIYIQDNTSASLPPVEVEQLAWAIRYQCRYHYNRSPWVEHGYAFACGDVKVLPHGQELPSGGWLVELLDTADQEGALGYHEDLHEQSSAHSTRGVAIHPANGAEVPLAKVFVKTAAAAGVPSSEVVSHEVLESLVDPWVASEEGLRKYLDVAAHEWYIGEVGDPCQGRGYDVGAPEKRTCGVTVADFAYPGWWKQHQTRAFTSAAEEFGLAPRLEPFTVAPGGYMSVAPEDAPSNWTQVYGSDRPKAEANAHAYEGGGS